MLIGHFAVGFAAKALAPSMPLGLLLAASQLLDGFWIVLTAAGIERFDVSDDARLPNLLRLVSVTMPFSHGLVESIVWSAAAAFIYLAVQPRARLLHGALLFGVVLSHWLLDYLVHPGDLPLSHVEPKRLYGLGMWHDVRAAFGLEVGAFLVAWGTYMWRTQALVRRNAVKWVLLAAALVAIQTLVFFWPVPDLKASGIDAGTVVRLSLAIVLVGTVLAGWRLDRYRRTRPSAGRISGLDEVSPRP